MVPDSNLSALAGELIYKQSKDAFWQYYTELYAQQPPEAQIWGTYEFLTKFVKENVTGIHYEKFNKELKEFKDFEEVKYDFEIAKRMNVQGTPTLFVNGQQLQNPSYELLKPNIEAELAKLRDKIIMINSIRFAWIVSVVATLGSLYFSEILGWVPCILCWYQRILMYPMSIILGVSVYF